MTAPPTATLKKPSKPWHPTLNAPAQQAPGPKRWAPWGYQKKAIKFLLERGAAALFLDPGMGKTSIVAAALKVLKRDSMMRGVLVIAPLRPAKLVWPAEFEKWADFAGMSVGVLHGDRKMKVLQADHDVYVINPEGLPWLFSRVKVGKVWKNTLTAAGKLMFSKCNILVIDELSKFKNTQTSRFKMIEPWLKKFDRRYGLTGSPAPNGLMDLFGQCLVLDDGRTFGPYITYYREQYFTALADEMFTYVLKPHAEEAIYERVRPLALSMSAEDHLELPPVRAHMVKMDLPPAARKHYEELEEELLTLMADTSLTAATKAVSSMMCRQICSGAIYKAQVDFVTGVKEAGPRQYLDVHSVKVETLGELLDELQGQQILIAYEFQHELERIQKRWPDIPRFGKSDKEDVRLEREWNAGTLPYVLGHPASIGHGLNLQGSSAHNIVWFSTTWDYELYDQLNWRLRRQGSNAKYINVYHLVMRNTVEESVIYALRAKKRTQDSFTLAIRTKVRLE